MKSSGLNFDSLTVFGGTSRVFGAICPYYNHLEFGNFALDITKDAVLNKEGKSTRSNKNWFNAAGFPDCLNIFCIMMMLRTNNILQKYTKVTNLITESFFV